MGCFVKRYIYALPRKSRAFIMAPWAGGSKTLTAENAFWRDTGIFTFNSSLPAIGDRMPVFTAGTSPKVKITSRRLLGWSASGSITSISSDSWWYGFRHALNVTDSLAMLNCSRSARGPYI